MRELMLCDGKIDEIQHERKTESAEICELVLHDSENIGIQHKEKINGLQCGEVRMRVATQRFD